MGSASCSSSCPLDSAVAAVFYCIQEVLHLLIVGGRKWLLCLAHPPQDCVIVLTYLYMTALFQAKEYSSYTVQKIIFQYWAMGIPHRTLSKVMLTMTTLTADNISPRHLNNITNAVKASTPIQESIATKIQHAQHQLIKNHPLIALCEIPTRISPSSLLNCQHCHPYQ